METRRRATVRLFFEGRELKPYGDFVRSADLVVGRVYFRMSYVDADSVLPELAPLVFLGRDLDSQERGLYFQDAPSYLGGERYDAVNWSGEAAVPEDLPATWRGPNSEFHVMPDSEYSSVFEYEGALDELLGCSLRRKTWDGHLRPIKSPAEPGGE